MQLLLLGLLVLLILIGQIYKIINDKNKLSREAFDMVNKNRNQIGYWEKSIRYYKSLGDNGLQDTIDEIEKNEKSDDFVALDSNNVLIETFESTRKNTENAIETCRSLTKCGQLDDFPNCGYCGSTNKFDYDGGSGIAPDVCLESKEKSVYSDNYNFNIENSAHEPNLARVNQWAKTKYDCLKIQRQNLCDTVKTCTQMAKGTEIGKICAWCPSDSKAKVKTTTGPKALLMYDGTGDKEANSKITSDKCPDMGRADPNEPLGEPLFSELTQAGSCSLCDTPIDGVARGATGIHSTECLKSLWKAPYVDISGIYNVTCNTEYNDISSANMSKYTNETLQDGKKPYYWIAAEMRNKIKRPIAKFMKEHDELNTIGGQHWKIVGEGGKYRREYDIDNTKNDETHVVSVKPPERQIDELWKKCFGENSRGNVENSFGKKST